MMLFLYFRYLHLQDNHAADVNHSDKLWKMRWFLDFLSAKFQSLYEVDGTVTVDESMIKSKGRLSFRQYLPMKPMKWGVKVWVMAESSTGYVSNFQVRKIKSVHQVAPICKDALLYYYMYSYCCTVMYYFSLSFLQTSRCT